MTRASARLAAALILAAAVASALAGAREEIDWFSARDVLPLRLEAPFNDLFAHAQQNGYSVHGTLIWRDGEQEQRLDEVKITVRGNTSRRESECTFPKLKLSWPGGSVKIGTHCGESTGADVTAKYGRLPNQTAPVREAFVYRLLDVLGIPTLRARQAEITYVYTDADGDEAARITRRAFLLEDDDAARRRLNASASIAPDAFTNARDTFTPEDTVRIAFAEALLGNFDWCLRFFDGDQYRCDARRPLWNLLAFKWPDGTTRPLMYDFDVSGVVAGYHRWFADIFNEQFLPSHAAVEVTAQLQHVRSLFDRRVLDTVRREFASKRDAAYRALADSPVDDRGKQGITDYFDAFFDAMTSDAAFYVPVVTAAHTRAYADADRTMPVCASVGSVPVGTPVSEPKQTRGDMIQVVVLDAMWKYAPPVKCGFIREKPVWIAKRAIGTAFP